MSKIPTHAIDNRFRDFVLGIALAIMLGWLLWIGKPIVLPILAAILAAYILTSAADSLRHLPLLNKTSEGFRQFVVLAFFVILLLIFATVIISTAEQLTAKAPEYQPNLESMLQKIIGLFGIEKLPNWATIRAATLDKISMQTLITSSLSSLTNIGTTTFLIIIYTSFLLTERHGFSNKLIAALADRERAAKIEALIGDINQRIGSYLATKTLINVILGIISYAILLVMGVDFALFWAIMIAVLNYIPYIGSIIGVLLPVMLTLAQFTTLQTTLILAALLFAAQTFVGNVLEPKMIGKSVNLSPFVVLTMLAIWGALWGLPGAILAIPLTSMLTITLSSFDSTRPIALMLSSEVPVSPEESTTDDS